MQYQSSNAMRYLIPRLYGCTLFCILVITQPISGTQPNKCSLLNLSKLKYKNQNSMQQKLYEDKYEHVYKLPSLQALCGESNEEEVCTDLDRRFKFQSKNDITLQRVKQVTVDSMNNLEYIDPDGFVRRYTGYFESVKIIKNPKLEELTLPKTAIKGSYHISENKKLKRILSNGDYQDVECFYYNDVTNSQEEHASIMIESFPAHNISFAVRTNAAKVNVKMPKLHWRNNNAEIFFEYKGRFPGSILLDYAGLRDGKNTKLTLKFDEVPPSLPDLLPPNEIRSHVKTMQVNFKNKDIQFVELDLIQATKSEHKTKVDISDESILMKLGTTKPRVTDLQDGKFQHDYVIADLKTISRNANEKKEYVVNTYFLLADQEIVDSATPASKIKVNFKTLLYIDYEKIYSFGGMEYEQQANIMTEAWKPLTLEWIYDIVIETIKIVQTNAFSGTPDLLKWKKRMALILLREVKKEDTLSLIIGLNKVNQHYLDKILTKVNDFIMFATRQDKNTNRLPRLSQKIFKEKTIIYQDMANLVISTKQIVSVQEGQKSLLNVARIKSQSQLTIAEEQAKQLEKKRIQGLVTLKKLQNKRQIYEHEVEEGTKAFNAAVKRRQEQATFDAVMGVFSAVAGVFSGSADALTNIDNVAKTFQRLKKLIDTIKRIRNLIKRIAQIIETLGSFANGVMGTYNDINVVQEGFDPGFEMRKVSEIDWDEYDKQTDDFSQDKMNDVVDQVSKLNAHEILEWDTAKSQVDGMMDASLSAEIPETLSYKTALLEMIAAGKAHTEAAIDFAELKVDIYMNQFKIKTYNKEMGSLDNAENALSEKHGDEKEFKKNLNLTEKELKVDFFLHTVDYCDAQFYYTLSPCFVFSEFSFDNSLEQMLYVSNKMLIESLDKINDLYPPPQTFVNKVVEYQIPDGCIELVNDMEGALKQASCQLKVDSDECGAEVDEVILRGFERATEAQKNQKTSEKVKQYMDCLASPVFQLIRKKTASISISSDQHTFEGFDRIRIDEIKIDLKGVDTNSSNKWVTAMISNEGIYQDRLAGKDFIFIGDIWQRMYRYRMPTQDNEPDSVEIIPDVYEDFKLSFNKPTPFASWIITLPNEENKHLNLDKLEAISIIFSGNLMIPERPDEDVPMVLNHNIRRKKSKRYRKARGKVTKHKLNRLGSRTHAAT